MDLKIGVERMNKVAIHQPHYFPWLGYLDKMANVDEFILLDAVQLTDKSNMFRNIFVTKYAQEKYLTVSFEKHGYMGKPFNQVRLNKKVNWQVNHFNFLNDNYGKAPYFREIMDEISFIFKIEYENLYEPIITSLITLKNLFGIETEIIFQNNLEYNKQAHKSELVLNLCLLRNATLYLSGIGAKKYMDVSLFEENDIRVLYQKFKHPIYPQFNTHEFVPNLSALDMLFNCGVEQSRKIFWDNVAMNRELY